MNYKLLKKNIRRFFLWFAVIIIALYMLFPCWWALVSSLKSEGQLYLLPATLIPRDPATGQIKFYFMNYYNVLIDPVFLKGMVNSCIVAFSTTLLALVSGSMAGFALGKLRFKGYKITLYLVLTMTMFPQVSVLAGLYAIISLLKLPAIFSLIMIYLLFILPFSIWVLTAFFRKIPYELIQAALIDGATYFQAYIKILLPLSWPALVTTGLLSFIASWNEYLFALTFTTVQANARTVPVAIALFSGTVSKLQPFGEIMAAAIIVTIPILIIVLVFQKKIIAGLTSGAVKE